MRSYSVAEAKDHFQEMPDHVRAGETVALTEDGKTVAEFTPKIVASEKMQRQSSDELYEMRQMFKGVTLEDFMSARHEGHKYRLA